MRLRPSTSLSSQVRDLERAKLRDGPLFTNSDPVAFKDKAKDDERPGQQLEAEEGPLWLGPKGPLGKGGRALKGP